MISKENITSVLKVVDVRNTDLVSYLVTTNEGKVSVPESTANTDYQEILEWVALGNTITDNGGGE